jgi:restriction endonuclease Mrr
LRGPSRVTHGDGGRLCVQCGTDADEETYTFCTNCGSINCTDHIKTERLEGTSVCTGCAVTERFALRTKYFCDEENLEAFREEYAAMPFYRKPFENKPLIAGGIGTALMLLVLTASYFGVF